MGEISGPSIPKRCEVTWRRASEFGVCRHHQECRVRVCVFPVLLAGLVACSEGGCGMTAPCVAMRSTATAIAGSWADVQALRGISMQFSVAARDTTLFGTVKYSMPPGVEDTASVTGYVFWQNAAAVPSGHTMPAHPVVVLNFTFANGLSAHFDQGVLQGRDTLLGVLTFSDSPFVAYGTGFVRAR